MKKDILNQEFKILDYGFVKLIDVMGNDTSIVQSARVSTGKSSKSPEEDRTLIRYLMRHHHTSPFEMVETKWIIKLPIFVARQWIRHRTASVNEVSGRYSILNNEFYTPEKDRIRGKGKINKQSSEGEVEDIFKINWLNSIDEMYSKDADLYNMANSFGISNELARISLPVSTYTSWVWKIDLHNLLHFLKLRLDPHAQYEIRVYAEKIAEILKEIVPVTYEAFEDYILNAVTFSRQEWEEIKNNKIEVNTLFLSSLEKNIPNELERREFIDKLDGALC